MDRADVQELLQRLSADDTGAVWRDFLARYAPLIMRIVRRYEAGDVPANDCFVHVCSALSDDGYRRLRAFRADGAARFDTWLKVVVSNLCVDWRRKQRGRIRTQRWLSRLSGLEQAVYRCLYVLGMSRAECRIALQAQFPELTDQRLSEVNAQLYSQLTPQQRWRASNHARVRVAFYSSGTEGDDLGQLQVPDPGPGPEEQVLALQLQHRVEAGMQRLEPAQRLLLRMRYEQNLTLAQIARLTGQPDTNRVYRQLEAAVVALRALVGT